MEAGCERRAAAPRRGAGRSGREEPEVLEEPQRSEHEQRRLGQRAETRRHSVGAERETVGRGPEEDPVLPQGPCSEPHFQEMIVALGEGQAGRVNLKPAPFF